MNLTNESTQHVIEEIYLTISDESLEENRNELFQFCYGRYIKDLTSAGYTNSLHW